MSSSSGVGPEQDPLERQYRVEEIERIRWDEEKRSSFQKDPPEDPDRNGFAAIIFLMWEKIVDFMKYSLQKGISVVTEAPIRENLLQLKASFEIMMQEDRSQDAFFLKNLSRLWQAILEQLIHFQMKGQLGKKLKTLIKEIEKYPEHEEHTFGYYLDEFAGQRWLPFPYMELIQKMHHQHELDPSASPLTRWCQMIEDILRSISDQV
ncbi:MAG: hypothetical protein FJZ64_02810 [Chlamydiae bacterium]|nr:hypothetical protein [Chlamydiota bacterium]